MESPKTRELKKTIELVKNNLSQLELELQNEESKPRDTLYKCTILVEALVPAPNHKKAAETLRGGISEYSDCYDFPVNFHSPEFDIATVEDCKRIDPDHYPDREI
jgi:hypothetical protein